MVILCIVVLMPVLGAAKEKPGRRYEAPKQAASNPSTFGVSAQWAEGEPWISAKVVISDNEQRIIRNYVQTYNGDHHGRKPKGLPPGLAKVSRGERLPPGWEKKCVPGHIMPADVYQRTHPVPPELVVKLPPPPQGTITVTVGGKVVRLAKATLEILDVFNVHVRL